MQEKRELNTVGNCVKESNEERVGRGETHGKEVE